MTSSRLNSTAYGTSYFENLPRLSSQVLPFSFVSCQWDEFHATHTVLGSGVEGKEALLLSSYSNKVQVKGKYKERGGGMNAQLRQNDTLWGEFLKHLEINFTMYFWCSVAQCFRLASSMCLFSFSLSLPWLPPFFHPFFPPSPLPSLPFFLPSSRPNLVLSLVHWSQCISEIRVNDYSFKICFTGFLYGTLEIKFSL